MDDSYLATETSNLLPYTSFNDTLHAHAQKHDVRCMRDNRIYRQIDR